MKVEFTVAGHPEPGGSKTAFVIGGRARVTDANPKAKGWKQTVASAARGAMLRDRLRPLDGPLSVEMTFVRERPKSHRLAGPHAPDTYVLNAEGRRNPYPTTKPDVLKLARSTEDAMSGIVYVDDAQIVEERLRKVYGTTEGVAITVTQLFSEEV